jgi:hypothetical protein
MKLKKVMQVLFLTLTVFGFAGWIYIVINSEVHPKTLGMQLTHFYKYPHEDTFGEICFAVSFVSFFIYNLIKEDKRVLYVTKELTKNKSSHETDVS